MSDQNHDSPKPLRVAGIDIPAQERSPLVLLLVGLIQKQAAEIQELRDETQRLKGITRRPTVKPNLLLKPEDKKRKQPPSKRPANAPVPANGTKLKPSASIRTEASCSTRCPALRSWKAIVLS